ncbi:MAG: hypothetical protein H6737_18310 [Alphaproteobacteria bacterium]|nr:hypothetical protein [Alphaproteobacteria bacterium]
MALLPADFGWVECEERLRQLWPDGRILPVENLGADGWSPASVEQRVNLNGTGGALAIGAPSGTTAMRVARGGEHAKVVFPEVTARAGVPCTEVVPETGEVSVALGGAGVTADDHVSVHGCGLSEWARGLPSTVAVPEARLPCPLTLILERPWERRRVRVEVSGPGRLDIDFADAFEVDDEASLRAEILESFQALCGEYAASDRSFEDLRVMLLPTPERLALLDRLLADDSACRNDPTAP